VGTSTSGTLHFVNAPGPDKVVTVTLQIAGSSVLVATPATVALSYTKGSGSPSSVSVNVTSGTTPAPFFLVDTASLPSWLTVDSTSGSVPKSLRLSSTSVCDSLAPGTYSATVRLKVATYGDLSVPVNLLITNPAPRLTVANGTAQTFSWPVGQALPTAYITLLSSDSPIAYSLTSGGPLAPVINPALVSGLAYSFGAGIPITFSSTAFAAAQPGSVLTGTVTISWGSPASTTVVTFSVNVLSPQATLSFISPGSLPTAAPGQSFTLTLTGAGFVPSTDPSQKTKVGIASNGILIQDTNIASYVSNANNIILTVTVAASDPYLSFTTGGGTIYLGVCNPQGTTCNVPTATVAFTIANGPTIQVITSASSFQQVNAGQNPSIAPYDMISIFGTNFCSFSSPFCSSSQVLPGILDPSTLAFQPYVTMDGVSATQRQLTAAFCPTGTTPTTLNNSCTNAPLLFATNSQINAMVPGGLATDGSMDLIVSYGYGTSANLFSSAAFPVNLVASDPGVFTIGSNGQGPGAILATDWSVIGAANPAGMRSTAADSDTIQIYMTGLGVPDSTNTGTGTFVAPADCLTPTQYKGMLNTSASSSLASVDGVIIQSGLLPTGKLPPCMLTNPTVTIGGVTATSVAYAGWVADSVAGLYQVNAKLPGSRVSLTDAAGIVHTGGITAPIQLPVLVTTASGHTQTGVTVWVAPRLQVMPPAPPNDPALIGQVGVAWTTSSNSVQASEGLSPYRYAVTSGVLPTGLSLNAGTGAIAGTPAAGRSGSYVITVTATDSNNVPLTGTTTFTLTIGGGLVVSSSSLIYSHPVVAVNTSTVTISAVGGAYPYTYTFDSSFAAAALTAQMTIDPASGVIGITPLTPAGPYNVKVMATDVNGWTGTITFPLTLTLLVTATSPDLTGSLTTFSGAAASGPFHVNLAAIGGTSYTFANATGPAGFTINGSQLTINGTVATANVTPYTVVITATDTAGATGTITLHITMN
jgi:uncharacterized protein (TIGR03437 family)